VRPCPRWSPQLPWVGWYCQLPRVVGLNCWLPAENDQLSNGDFVTENSFGRFLTTGEPLSPVIFSAFGWYCQLPEVVCQNCWPPAEKMVTLSESSFVWFLPLFFYSRVPLSFHENRGTKVTTSRSPCWWKALIRPGAAQCPEGIVSDIAITTSVLCSRRHDTSHFGFGEPEPCSPSEDVAPPRR
jgi:hypothetical protein